MKMTTKPKKGTDSDTKDSNSEHELSYYLNDRIKMMQEALKEVKSKKLLAMAPDCLKDLQISEIKSLMLEELLGISNKRLGRILAGENLNDETSSSSDSEFEQKPEIDVISLDDITDGSEICISDDNIMEIQLSERERLEMESVAEQSKTSKKGKGKSAGHKGKNKRKVSVKKEKPDKAKKKHKKKPATIESEVCSSTSQPTTQDPVMNVLNLLELQARARAIRSQLANEVLIKKVSESETVVPDHPEQVQPKISQKYDSDSSNSVIFIGPENIAVVTVNSDSESELKEDINNDLTMDNVSPKQGRSDICINTNKKTNKSSFLDNDDDILVVSEETILEKESETTENTKLDKYDSNNSEENSNQSDNVSWQSRWLQSRKVTDVMRTSKMYNHLRQKIKLNRTSSQENPISSETKDFTKTTVTSEFNEITETVETGEPAETVEFSEITVTAETTEVAETTELSETTTT